MHDTGRLTRALPAHLRRIVFGARIGAHDLEELTDQAQIDRATAVVLTQAHIWDRDGAAAFIDALDRLEDGHFAALAGIEPVRGLYMAYEQELARQPGGFLAANLQRGRSRNDLRATITRMRMRRRVLRVLKNLLQLAGRLETRAASDDVMPLFTHTQQAVPGTVGHYFAGAGFELLQDINRLMSVWPELQRCPLGASAVGGTSLPLDTQQLAELLGFEAPIENSVQAVASRNYALNASSALAICGVTLSRLASDILWWATDEMGFIHLPDHLVGSSSHLPQKRNPFVLEIIGVRAASAAGVFANAANAMAGKPFSNSVAVGTEAMRLIWQAFDDVADASVLLEVIVADMEFRPTRMRAVARGGPGAAAAVADLLADRGIPYREAHHAVGELVNAAEYVGRPFLEMATRTALREHLIDDARELEPESLVSMREYGGGPGPQSMKRQREILREQRHALIARWKSICASLRASKHQLTAEAGALGIFSTAPRKGDL